MGTTAQKLEYLGTTKSQLKQMISYGYPLTNETFRQYVGGVFKALINSMSNTTNPTWNNLPKITTTPGTSQSINNTIEAPMRIELGASELSQETTTGKNLYDIDNSLSSALVKNGNQYTISKNGGTRSATAVPLVVEENTDITISFDLLETNLSTYGSSNLLVSFAIVNDDDTNKFISMYDLTIGKKSATFSLQKKTKTIRMYLSDDFTDGAYITFKDFMVSTSSDTTYEPYTNGASPNPSYPQDIHTISGSNKVVVNGSNLTIKNVKGYFNTQATAINVDNNSESFVFYAVEGTTYTYSCQETLNRNIIAKVDTLNIVNGTPITNIRTLGQTQTFTSEFTGYCILYVNSTKNENIKNSFMINVGETALPYTPYVSQEADIDLKSKNFFDEALLGQQTGYNTYKGGIWTTNGASAWFLSILYNVASSTTRDVTKLIPLGVGTYTIKINDFVNNTGHASPINWRLFDVSGEQLSTENTANTTITITTTQKCYLDICRTNSTGTLSFSTIMINKGSTALPYVPYYDYGFYGKIGNYEDKFIRNSGKNKLPTNNINISQAQMTVNSQVGGGLLFNGTKYGASAFNFNSFDLEPGDYTFAIRRNGGSCSGTNIFNFINTATNQVQFTKSMYMTYMTTPGWNNDRILNFTLTEKTNLLFSMTIPDYNVFTNFDMEMVIYKGTLNADTLGEYEPYGSNELYIKNTIFEKIFDGNENWGNAVQVESSNYYRYENQDFRENNCLIHSTYLSDKFKYNGTTGLTEQNVITNTTAANTNRLWITIDTTLMNGTTVADFKTWLSTHNVKVKYVANTPTYTKITGTLAEQLENVYQKMLSYSGQTNISQVNNDLSFVINASALEELS